MPLRNTHADISSKARGLNFDLSLHLHPYVMYSSSNGSNESVLKLPRLNNEISTEISCTGLNILYLFVIYLLFTGYLKRKYKRLIYTRIKKNYTDLMDYMVSIINFWII